MDDVDNERVLAEEADRFFYTFGNHGRDFACAEHKIEGISFRFRRLRKVRRKSFCRVLS